MTTDRAVTLYNAMKEAWNVGTNKGLAKWTGK